MPSEHVNTTIRDLSLAAQAVRWLPNQARVQITAHDGVLELDWQHGRRKGGAVIANGQVTYTREEN